MTAHRDLKKIIRDRRNKTGESYTTARTHVMQARSRLLGLASEPPENPDVGQNLDAAVLKVNRLSIRARLLEDGVQLTFRSRDAWKVVPGHVAALVVDKRWTWRGDAYATGRIENPRIDAERLGLVPLPLSDWGPEDLRSAYEGFRSPDPYAPLWRNLTARPRAWYVMDPIAGGELPGADPENDLIGDSVDLAESGDISGARKLLMSILLEDLRCIDAHAHLGNLEFDDWPKSAIVHYEVGVRIAELSLPPDFDGVLPWGCTENRPFLRCLHGYGLCLWRLDRFKEAQAVFERILSLNPNDNQGVRFCWQDLLRGRSWEEAAG